MNTLVFIFLGEFGYELLNWQGVIRKLKSKLKNNYMFIACSRRGMNNFYETCDKYVDISEIKTFQNSVASCYKALGINKTELIETLINSGNIPKESSIFFSDDHKVFEGLKFGRFGKHGIYHRLDLNNNLFSKINPDLKNVKEISSKVNFDITNNSYVLVQQACRKNNNKSGKKINSSVIINALMTLNQKIVLLGFNTMRNMDSYSNFDFYNGAVCYSAKDFVDQGCLINYAKKCVFITEGDLRSHIYIPPFMGKDVYAVAHEEVFGLATSPIDFWNKEVFTFGGQIKPIKLEYEDIMSSEKVLEKLNAFINT